MNTSENENRKSFITEEYAESLRQTLLNAIEPEAQLEAYHEAVENEDYEYAHLIKMASPNLDYGDPS